MDNNQYILLTIDVEDWFQVENFRSTIPFETWDQCELRVEKNTHRLLNLFDSIEFTADNQKETNYAHKNVGQRTTENGQTNKVRATFFILGWIAERLPGLVREIRNRGHEIASHGYNHKLCNQLSHSELKKELTDSKQLLEDISGSPISGFRAPNFSISDDILKFIEDCGYQYDSSYNSFSLHGRYGHISLNGDSKLGIAHIMSENFFELPISNIRLNGRILPWGGGAYFRLLPSSLFKMGVHSILKKDKTYLFYAHPWEIDPNQPKIRKASLNYRFRHYTNIGKTSSKLTSLMKRYKSCLFITCSEYIKEFQKS